MAVDPSSHGVDGLVSAVFDSNPNLCRPKVCACLILHQSHETFAGETPEDFADGDRSDAAGRLGESDQTCTGQHGATKAGALP